MPNYVLTYHGEMGDMPSDPAAMEAIMAEWGQWYGSIGEGLIDGGAPFSQHWGVGPDGADADAPATALTGYTVVSAPDLAAAKKIAQGCPVLASGNTVQISESIDMAG